MADMAKSTPTTKPNLILTCTPGKGHVHPISTIAKALIQAGYPLTVVSSSHYRPTFTSLGARYVAIQGYGDYWDGDRDAKWPQHALLAPGSPEQFAYALEHSFFRVIPDQLRAVQTAISQLRTESPTSPIIVLNESASVGALPLMRSCDGPKPDGMIGIGINPVSLSSRDVPPFGPGLPLPRNDEDRAAYAAMQAHMNKTIFAKPLQVLDEILESVGVGKIRKEDGPAFDAPYTWPDRFLQMCPASIMYPRSDAPSTFRYAGGLPKLLPNTTPELPEWWNEAVIQNPQNNKIVFVCQGTVIFDYGALVLPTIEALRNRPNTIVIAVLGLRGATLPSQQNIPANVHVADYLPYDAILPHADVFVGNGGYGGVIHSLSHGTPMVLAGETEDKAEMCAITAWAGAAVNLRSGRPSVAAIREGVDEVLGDGRYKEVCENIKREMEGSDPLRVIGENVDELVRAAGF
ncbi:hypothetical protein QBC37DRAFT_386174 [Rhypophila decipiens]|uniref:Erythromycin biosynthesis protein CIII-like C-terminal domain-containing protein n=1 Tax=Rhypophila decipiens TaxID=261697 RepID=A0AAN6YG90_9PEZI|nr:hypothetical protein QBC37DRAFT_386174 [Rhypophila decipiens]